MKLNPVGPDGSSIPEAQLKIAKALAAKEVPPQARAESLIYVCQQLGLDLVPVMAQLIADADQTKELKARAAEDERSPFMRERFLGAGEHLGQPMAAVTSGTNTTYVPCSTQDIDGMRFGESVLINIQKGRLAGRDGRVPASGELATVTSVLEDGTHRVAVSINDQPILANVVHWLWDKLRIDDQVVIELPQRMVCDLVRTESDGQELLVDIDELDRIDPSEIAPINPVLDEIAFRVGSFAKHADWLRQMNVRQTCSYLLTGVTGTGKSTTLKAIARNQTDALERLTGRRISRLVLADAGDFYSSWFGETERKIRSWFQRLKKLARTDLSDRDGHPVHSPLLVVLEEAEALFRARGTDHGGSGHLFDRPLALILKLCSSVGNELGAPVILCVTTNKPTLLDAAALRRFGMRRATFTALTAGQTRRVLEKKIPAGLPLLADADFPSNAAARDAEINRVTTFCYGDDPPQPIAEVRLVDGGRRAVERRQLVTPALLEEAISAATDECIRQSDRAGTLLGLDADVVIAQLQQQFENIAATMRPYNLEDYLPQWFTEETIRIESIRPVPRRTQRTRAALVSR